MEEENLIIGESYWLDNWKLHSGVFKGIENENVMFDVPERCPYGKDPINGFVMFPIANYKYEKV